MTKQDSFGVENSFVKNKSFWRPKVLQAVFEQNVDFWYPVQFCCCRTKTSFDKSFSTTWMTGFSEEINLDLPTRFLTLNGTAEVGDFL